MMTCVPGLIEISSIYCLEQSLIQQPSPKHRVMPFVTDDVSNVKDFESYDIGLRVL